MRIVSRSMPLCASIILALSAQSSFAQDWLRQAIPIESRSHSFGTVARAAKTEHRFVIKNVLEKDLHIRSVRASCGCTTPIIETKFIKPGEEGTILARFNTGTFTGQKRATLTVVIDKPFYTELQLNVGGYIRSDIVLNPGEAQFGKVDEGEGKSLQLQLDYAGRNDWELTKVGTQLSYVSAEFEEVSRTNGRVRYNIDVSLAKDAPAGLIENQLILHTNDRRLTSVPLRLLANVESAFQFSPREFSLGQIELGLPLDKRLVLKSKKPFKVLKIESSVATIDFEASDASKAAHLLNLKLTPTGTAQQGDAVQGQLKIFTDLQDAPFTMQLEFSPAPHPSPSEITATQTVK